VLTLKKKKTETSQINNLKMHSKLLENKNKPNPKPADREKLIKIRAEINKIETEKQCKESKKQKVGL
jgi:hypothetical protein